MAKEGSVAPKERINIRYVPMTNGQQAEVELPLRIMTIGNFTGRRDDAPLEERPLLSVDKNTFSSVMAEAGLGCAMTVRNTLSDEEGAELPVELTFGSLRDFEPDSIVRKVPELRKLIELREALVALKGPLGNLPAFRNRLQQLLDDEQSRERLLRELDGLAPAQNGRA